MNALVGRTLRVGAFELEIIEKTRVEHHSIGSVFLVHGRKEPMALLVRHQKKTYGFDMNGAPLTAEQVQSFAERDNSTI